MHSLPGAMRPMLFLKKFLVFQKRVLRLIYFTDRTEHAIPLIPLFAKARILPVTFGSRNA